MTDFLKESLSALKIATSLADFFGKTKMSRYQKTELHLDHNLKYMTK
jgi:hypothetical protein